MSNLRCMDQPSTRNGSKNKQLFATTARIMSLSSQTVQHQRLMRILKPPPSYSAKLCEGERFNRQHGYRTHAYNPLCCDKKLHDHFQPNPIESNSNPIEGQIEGWSINESEHREHRQNSNTRTHHSQQQWTTGSRPFLAQKTCQEAHHDLEGAIQTSIIIKQETDLNKTKPIFSVMVYELTANTDRFTDKLPLQQQSTTSIPTLSSTTNSDCNDESSELRQDESAQRVL